MEPRLTALKLIYDALGIPVSVDSERDKIRLQKALYVAQRKQVDLGYRFAWFERGPYCTELAEDYHRLAFTSLKPSRGAELEEDAAKALKRIRRVFESCPVGLDDYLWLELLASLDFLRHVSRYGEDIVERVIRREKPSLLQYKSEADKALAMIGLPSR